MILARVKYKVFGQVFSLFHKRDNITAAVFLAVLNHLCPFYEQAPSTVLHPLRTNISLTCLHGEPIVHLPPSCTLQPSALILLYPIRKSNRFDAGDPLNFTFRRQS